MRITLALCLMLQIAHIALAQTILQPPHFKGSSVDLLNDRKITLYWLPSISDPNEIKNYRLYQRDLDHTGNYITRDVSSTAPTASSYLLTLHTPYKQSLKYSLNSEAPEEKNSSVQTDFLTTLYLDTPQWNSCTSAIQLNWSPFQIFDKFSPETPIINNTIRYAVWYTVGATDELTLDKFKPIAQELETHSFTFPSEEGTMLYHFFVRAYYNNGSGNIDSSQSNRVTQPITQQHTPKYITIDSVIRNEKETSLHFHIDPSGTYENFDILKSINNIDFFPIAQIGRTAISHTTESEPMEISVSYKISLKNDCGTILRESSPIRLIVPKIEARPTGFNICISPNICAEGQGNYTIQRTSPNPIDLIVNSSNECYFDEINKETNDEYISEASYNHVTRCTQNSKEVLIKSKNNKISAEPVLYLPNAIIPNHTASNPITGKIRGIFEPISPARFTFTLSVHDTNGNLVYRGEEGWNGRINNQGNMVEEGVYLYILEVRFFTGKIDRRKGSVTVLY